MSKDTIRSRDKFLPGGLYNPNPPVKNNFHSNFLDNHPQLNSKRAGPNGFTDRQRAFVREYLKHGIAEKAAMDAGYTAATAGVSAHYILKNPKIAAEITKVQEERRRRHEITADRIIEELARIAFANVLDYVRPTASGDPYVDFSSLTRDDAAALNISIEKSVEGYGDDTREVVRTKYTMQDKMSALRDLARHFGLFNDRGNTIEDARGDPHTALIDAVNRLAARQLPGGTVPFPRSEDGAGTSVQLEVLGETEPAAASGDD